MSRNFNAIERFCAKQLGKFPLLKNGAKVAYSWLSYHMSRKPAELIRSGELLDYGSASAETFFGYYDKSPESDGGMLVYYKANIETKVKPDPKFPLSVIVQSLSGDLVVELSTSAYNWQQGARAHWLDSDLLIYNDFDSERSRYISYVYSLSQSRIQKKFNAPVQDSYRTEYFLSINYQRLLSLNPDYGYRNLLGLSGEELNNLKDDGIWKVDYKSGDIEMLISLESIASLDCEEIPSNALHSVNHVMISPNGNKIIFIHRYYVKGRRFDRLMLADKNGESLRVVSSGGMVSHCCWIDNENILSYLRGPNNEDAYFEVCVSTSSFRKMVGEFNKFGDGHPFVQGDWFVSDTYPNKSRVQTLFSVNMRNSNFQTLGELHHGLEYRGECRCDLHPRISPNGERIYFDSVRSGKRRLYSLRISDEV